MSTDELPSGWTRAKFGDIAASITERVDDPSAAGVDRYVGLEHLDPESTTVRRWGSPSDVESTKLRFYPGDVIYGRRRAYQRKLGVADFDGICSAHALVLRAKPEVCLPQFLPYFLQSDAFHERALDISVGSLSPTINWKTLAVQVFTLPPIEEQQRIVELMSAADGAVGAYSRLRSASADLRDSVLLDSIWDDSLKNWSVPMVRVGDLLTEPPRNGVSPPASPEGEGSLTVSISAVQQGRFVPKPAFLKWCRPEGDPSGFVVRSGDAFAVRGNGNRSLVGRLGLCEEAPHAEVLYPDLLIRLRFDPQRIDPVIATAMWNLGRVHERLLDRAKSSNGIYKVNGQDISNHRLPVPPRDVQEDLLRRIVEIDRVGAATEASLAAGVRMRRSLLAKVLEG